MRRGAHGSMRQEVLQRLGIGLLVVALAGIVRVVVPGSSPAGALGVSRGTPAPARTGATSPGSTTDPTSTLPGKTIPSSTVPLGPNVGIHYDPDAPLSTLPYSPTQVRVAYNLGPVYAAGLTGAGVTIGLVDVYGSPTIRSDLEHFDATFGLPNPPSFRIIEPAGHVPRFNPSSSEEDGWAGETTLDVEWAHAIAPGASIVLALTGVNEVEGTSGLAQIMSAEEHMILHDHVSVISQSFGATEGTFPEGIPASFRRPFEIALERHVTVLAAAGDDGATGPENNGKTLFQSREVGWPASDPLVTAVGGTQLYLARTGEATEPAAVWHQPLGGVTGGGVSEIFSRPSWQDPVQKVVGAFRGLPDISMVASCQPGNYVYATFDRFAPRLQSTCGTSLATPIFAGVVALADQLAGKSLGDLNPSIYSLGEAHAEGLVDVTSGDNSESLSGGKSVQGYDARPGYDLASGWGTVDGAAFVPELAGKALP